MKHRSRHVRSLLLSALGLPVLVFACASDDTGAGRPSVAQTPGQQLCDSLKKNITACGASTPCDDALVRDCASVVDMMSENYLFTTKGCLESGGSPASCLASSFKGLTPSQAHQSFAKTFCGECLGGVVPACDALFFGQGGSIPDELKVAGALILPLGDGLVSQIESECARKNPLTCAAQFSSCAQGVLATQALPQDTLACLVDGLVNGDTSGKTCSGTGGAGGASGFGGTSGSGGMSGGGGVGTGGSGTGGVGTGGIGGSGTGGVGTGGIGGSGTGGVGSGGIGGSGTGGVGSGGIGGSGTGGGGVGGTGGGAGNCSNVSAFSCGASDKYCDAGSCSKCASGKLNCNGVAGCECAGTCNGTSCSTCTDPGPEPNNSIAQASPACAKAPCNTLDCNALGGGSIAGVVKPGDTDFFTYNGIDDLCEAAPSVSTQSSGVKACVFAKCKNGASAFKSCAKGLTESEGALKGCCTSKPGEAKMNIDCPGLNDSATVYMRVTGTNANACTAYDLTYDF